MLASIEVEKVENNRRWAEIENLSFVEKVLADFGVRPEEVDKWIVDGWEVDRPLVRQAADGAWLNLAVAPYRETGPDDDILTPVSGGGLRIAGADLNYTSYRHVAGHILGSWATSPFAATGNETYVLAWDGGIEPRLYCIDPKARRVRNLGPLFPMLGHAYSYATKYYGPFKGTWASGDGEDASPGKMMAYIALGRERTELTRAIRELYDQRHSWPDGDLQTEYLRTSDGTGYCGNATALFEAMREVRLLQEAPHEDVLLAIHNFLQELLLEGLVRALRRSGATLPVQLCFAGGCALNIKWNRALRALPEVADMYVPPFPNDSGAAIGMIACDLFLEQQRGLEWNAYLGPALHPSGISVPQESYTVQPCDLPTLARLLASTGEPIVFLNGRAELGPRALGHRSILADPRSASIRDELNRIKGREDYRPVAPVCLQARSSEIFSPGGSDPFMLYEHEVLPEWRARIPGVVHLDGSARLQTVSAQDDPDLHAVLAEFERLTGVPVLCNTSANFGGKGFFPDVESALLWGGARYVWAGGRLFERVQSAPDAPANKTSLLARLRGVGRKLTLGL